MMTKRNVRERRHNRIRALLKQNGAPDKAISDKASFPGLREARQPDDRSMPELRDDRWLDPEYVWKQRQRMLEGGGTEDPPMPRMIRSLLIRLVISAVLFGAAWLLYQSDAPWALRAQGAVSAAMGTAFDFQAVEAWYERHFSGFPSFIPVWKGEPGESEKVNADPSDGWRKPVEGRIIQAFSSAMPGVLLEVPAAAEAVAIDTGRVLFVGETSQTGLTVIIQHSGGLHTLYGRLASTDLEKDDWLDSGEPVGAASGSAGAGGRIYFAMKRGDAYLDPAAAFDFE